MKERYNEEGFNEFLDDLLKSGRIEKGSSAYGITMRVIDKGYESLKGLQPPTFDSMIQNNTVELCSGCGCPIPWSEMLNALENGGYCSHCQHVQEELEKD